MLSVSGPVEGTDSVEVVSNLHAEILEIPVKEGDRVEKDQLLATLDEKDAKKEVDIAQNAYDLAVTTYNEKQIELRTAMPSKAGLRCRQGQLRQNKCAVPVRKRLPAGAGDRFRCTEQCTARFKDIYIKRRQTGGQ